MQGHLNEFLAAHDSETDNEIDNNDGSRGPRASRAGTGAVSIAAASIGAAFLGVKFRATRRTLDELN